MSRASCAVIMLWALGSLFGAIGCGGEEQESDECKGQQDCTLPQVCGADGQCAAPDPVAEGTPCLHPAHCTSGSCLDLGDGARCGAPCAEPADCGADRSCGPVAATAVSVLADLEKPADCLMRPARPYNGVGSLLVPGTDDPNGKLAAGSHQIWVATYDLDELRGDPSKLVRTDGRASRVAALTRRAGHDGGLLDLNVHFSPDTGLSVEQADSDYVTVFLGRFRQLYRNLAGIQIGELRLFDLSDDAGALDGDGVRALCRDHAVGGARGLALNVFIVKELTFGARGFAAVVPGIPGLYGSSASGVVLQRLGNPTTMGHLMAHEVGHFMGLWHTTELSGATHDPISDTPKCPPETPVANCPDLRNMMFPSFVASGSMNLSTGQVNVLRGSPWLYEVRYPQACGNNTAVVDISSHGLANGRTMPGGEMTGSCGGQNYGERVHLFRIDSDAHKLKLSVTAHGFEPVLYLRKADCTDTSAEVACAVGEEERAELELEAPGPGAYYIVVDGADGSGRYELTLTVQAEPPE